MRRFHLLILSRESKSEQHQGRVHLGSSYFGGCNPVESSQSSIWAAVSACWAFLRSISRSGPGRSLLACSRTSFAHAESRSQREIRCLKRRRLNMAHSFPPEEGGSAIGVLITDRSQGLGGDTKSMRLSGATEQSTSEHSAKLNEPFIIEFGQCPWLNRPGRITGSALSRH